MIPKKRLIDFYILDIDAEINIFIASEFLLFIRDSGIIFNTVNVVLHFVQLGES